MATDLRAQAIDALLKTLRDANERHGADTIKWRDAFGEALSQFKKTSGYQRMPKTLIDALQAKFGISKDKADKLRDAFDRGAAESELATARAPETEPEAESGTQAESQSQPGSEIETVEPVHKGEIVEPLSEEAARELDQKIRTLVGQISRDRTTLQELVDRARNGQIHAQLGFPSWPAYLGDALADQFHQVGVEERRKVVPVLLDSGVSNYVAAKILGVTEGTIRGDVKALASIRGLT